jgi:DNA invertase Pin-like site-specific DNA recombinase
MRNPWHLVGLVDTLHQREIGLKVLAGAGAQIDTTTANGRLVFGIFAALAEIKAELIRERTKAWLMAARARGRLGGRPRARLSAGRSAPVVHRGGTPGPPAADPAVGPLSPSLAVSPAGMDP